MKRLILLLFLLTIAWMPYILHRWLTLPYTAAAWESYLIYTSVAITTAIGVGNILLVLLFKFVRYRLLVLKGLAGLLLLLLCFPIIMGVLNAYGGEKAWVDVLALVLLYGHFYWLYQVHERLRISYENDNL